MGVDACLDVSYTAHYVQHVGNGVFTCGFTHILCG